MLPHDGTRQASHRRPQRSQSSALIPPPFQFPPSFQFSVIPAKAGIYALRWTPVFAAATDPHLGHMAIFTVIPLPHPSLRFNFPHHSNFIRHSGASRNLRVAMDSGFRQSVGSTPKPPGKKRYRCRPASFPIQWFNFSRHSNFIRHSGESRNLHAAMDSSFRRSVGSTPKPPERKHYPPAYSVSISMA